MQLRKLNSLFSQYAQIADFTDYFKKEFSFSERQKNRRIELQIQLYLKVVSTISH